MLINNTMVINLGSEPRLQEVLKSNVRGGRKLRGMTISRETGKVGRAGSGVVKIGMSGMVSMRLAVLISMMKLSYAVHG